MEVDFPALGEAETGAWHLLFELHNRHATGWALVGAQMVILHAAAHGVERPVRTRDTDVLVDIRAANLNDFVEWLVERGFELEGISADGIGHRFIKGDIVIDLLAIDHTGTSDRTTLPPARTIEVPGGRDAANRVLSANVVVGDASGVVLVPDWVGAVVLKARAALALAEGREKHLTDVALLLGLSVDVRGMRSSLTAQERKHLRAVDKLMTQDFWANAPRAINTRDAQGALAILTR